MKWLREILWKLGEWNSKELNSFIKEFNPDIFLYSIESYPYFNRINEYIIDKYNPQKVIAYLWDDNFTYKQYQHNIVRKIERFFLRKQVKRLINKSTQVLAISPKMKKECDLEFDINSVVITKPISDSLEYEPYKPSNPIKILYTGKLIIGRYDTLLKIANHIREINSSEFKFILDIYTQTNLSDEAKSNLNIPGCVNLHSAVSKNKVIELQKNADILLFAESLSNRNLTARLSFSTKLTDYFAAGKCIWAVGNQDLGPINYIKEENAGLVSNSEEEIINILNKISKSPELINDYSQKSYNCGVRNHNSTLIQTKLSRIFT